MDLRFFKKQRKYVCVKRNLEYIKYYNQTFLHCTGVLPPAIFIIELMKNIDNFPLSLEAVQCLLYHHLKIFFHRQHMKMMNLSTKNQHTYNSVSDSGSGDTKGAKFRETHLWLWIICTFKKYFCNAYLLPINY